MSELTNATWVKSTRSSGTGQCVEVAITETVVGVRDSKDRSGPVLKFSPDEWRAFIAGAADGEFRL